MTLVFSYLLSQLKLPVVTGGKDVSTMNFGGWYRALDGLLTGLKYFLMETASNAGVIHIQVPRFIFLAFRPAGQGQYN
jgi:hypothetical protein